MMNHLVGKTSKKESQSPKVLFDVFRCQTVQGPKINPFTVKLDKEKKQVLISEKLQLDNYLVENNLHDHLIIK